MESTVFYYYCLDFPGPPKSEIAKSRPSIYNTIYWENRPAVGVRSLYSLFQRQSCGTLDKLAPFFSTYFQIPMHNSVMVAVVNAFQDLLNTVRGVGLAVEFPGDDVLEQFSAGDSVSVLRFNSISRARHETAW